MPRPESMRLTAQDEKQRAELRPTKRKPNRLRSGGKSNTRDEITVSRKVARHARPHIFGEEA